MFKEPTTFILGAGASWHYGYPTGADLIDEIISMTKESANELKDSKDLSHFYYNFVEGTNLEKSFFAFKDLDFTWLGNEPNAKYYNHLCEMKKLHERLVAVNPLVIDFFLQENADLQEIGRYCIAHCLYYKELNNKDHSENYHRKDKEIVFKNRDDWCKFIINKLVRGCKNISDLSFNKVQFITFNYDVSLERRLYTALSSIDLFSKEKDFESKIVEFISERVIHIYGKMRDDFDKKLENTNNFPKESQNFIFEESNRIMAISKNLKLISPKTCEDIQILSWQKISDSKEIFILGYGFDGDNNTQIGFDKLFEKTGSSASKRINFTNFNSSSKISKSILKYIQPVCRRNYENLEEGFFRESGSLVTIALSEHNGQKEYTFDKSIRNVYEALEKDFDL